MSQPKRVSFSCAARHRPTHVHRAVADALLRRPVFERACLALVERQIEQLEATRRARLLEPRTAAERRIVHLMRLRAIGPTSAWLLVKEFFGWRAFRNRREVAALAGLVGTPYSSGESQRDQGI